jgi:hypothetical protein
VTHDEAGPPLLRFRGWYTPNLVVMPHDTDPRARRIAVDIGQAARGAPGGDRIRVELDDRGMATWLPDAAGSDQSRSATSSGHTPPAANSRPCSRS